LVCINVFRGDAKLQCERLTEKAVVYLLAIYEEGLVNIAEILRKRSI
jgi:hypothetical protein